MNKLLSAAIKRIFKIKTLYLCLGVIIVLDAFDIIKEYLAAEDKAALPAPEGYLLSGLLMIVLLAAVFISSYLGSEHAFGTLRNKLSVGYSRQEIYRSSFMACYLAVMIMYAAVWLVTFSLGTLLLGGFHLTAKELLIKLVTSFLAITVLTALYVMIALCIQSKSLCTAASIITAFVMMMAGVGITMMLSQPEQISEAKLREFRLADDLCPVSQILKDDDELPAKNVLIPVAEILITAAAGAVVFKKRDLK